MQIGMEERKPYCFQWNKFPVTMQPSGIYKIYIKFISDSFLNRNNFLQNYNYFGI